MAALAVAVSSCGGLAPPDRSASPVDASQAAPDATHNADDVAFARDMMPHHQQAVEMSAMVPSRSDNPALLVVANHISSDQQAELLTLQGLLAQWGESSVPHHGHGDPAGMTISGMVDDRTLNQLRSLRGKDFDALWISAMIGHHQGAITMAKTVLARGSSAEARRLADMIITAQRREIAQMNQLMSFAE